MLFYNARQRKGMLAFLFVIWLLVVGVYLYDLKRKPVQSVFEIDKKEQMRLDSLAKIYDSLQSPAIYPFNPNYLSDYRAYIMGIDTVALKKIRLFRKQGKFFKSKEHFKEISGIDDSLFNKLEPYIRITYHTFPNYKKNKRDKNYKFIEKKDINRATAEDLKKIYGIGEILSGRIIKYRNKLGGFTIKEQLRDVYALSEEAYENLWKYFEIKTPKRITDKIDLNSADMQELQKNPYIDFDLAEKIVEYRSLHGKFKDLEDLKKIKGFPSEKYERIILYLQIN